MAGADRHRARTRVPFGAALAIIGLLAFAVRAAYAIADAEQPGVNGDADWYHAMANLLADGRGYDNPFRPEGGGLVPTGGDAPPTAFHPPLFPGLLALVSAAGLRSYDAHELAGCAMGAVTAVLVALVARELASPRAGLLAGVACALWVPLVGTDSVLMSESLFGLTIALALLAAVAALQDPSRVNLAALGVAIALAALTRGEGLFLLVLLALPVALSGGALRRFGVVALATAALVAPWTARNWIAFDRPVLVTTTDGAVLALSNNRTAYGGGPSLGYVDYDAIRSVPPSENEAVYAARLREQGLGYAAEHAGRVPVVVAARVLRTWSLWPPRDQVDVASLVHGQPRAYAWLALVFFWAALAAGTATYLAARRAHRHLWVLLAPAAMATLASAVAYGDGRFRVAIDVALAVLAGIALDRVLSRLRRRAASPGVDSTSPPSRTVIAS